MAEVEITKQEVEEQVLQVQQESLVLGVVVLVVLTQLMLQTEQIIRVVAAAEVLQVPHLQEQEE